jgi:hypothetical protein
MRILLLCRDKAGGASFVLGIAFVTGDRMQTLTQRLNATKPMAALCRMTIVSGRNPLPTFEP